MSKIYQKLNDRTFYITGVRHDNLVTVVRNTAAMTPEQQ